MNTKEQWIDSFEEELWGYHTCDWDAGNRYPDYPFQVAVAYFDCNSDCTEPNRTAEEAFKDYLESEIFTTDEKALVLTEEILDLLPPLQNAYYSQVKAKIQCLIIKVLESDK